MSLPHRADVASFLTDARRPLHVAEIAARFSLDTTRAPALSAMLDDMVMTGALRALPGNRYLSPDAIGKGAIVEEAPTLAKRMGREKQGFLSINPRGFGFVAGTPGEQDIFIAPNSIGGGMNGDLVRVRLGRGGARGPEGEVVEIIKRGASRVPGTLRRRGRSTWLEPDDVRMRGPIVLEGLPPETGAEGDAVVVKITRYPERHDEQPQGELIAILGRPGEPHVEVAKILAREEIVEAHPEASVAEARAFGEEITAAQIDGREDLRHLPLCTIDPHDARDHDDAVYVRRAEGGDAAYVAWIAIADVASYVTPGSALDADARGRGCSVYLPDRAIPMLPRELSTHLCSLVANEDRLTLAVEVVLDATGEPLRHRLVRGVMRSRAKLSYEDAARALGFMTDVEPSDGAKALLGDLKVAWELSSLLRARRMRRGALDFDLPEAKVKLDAEGVCIDVIRSRADPGLRKAYSLIEELMLLANETVAEDLSARGLPTIFRVHGLPDEKKLERFAALAQTLGVGFKMEDARDPKALGKFLKAIAQNPQANILNTLLLRSLKQATYDLINIGHFGLASKAYLHFTSPIRRYPDLVVHRTVHAICQGGDGQSAGKQGALRIDRSEKAIESMREAAMLSSQTERKAMEVEREVVDLHRALLMKSHIGETYEGQVTGVVGSGVFVALDAPYVDVMVKLEALGGDAYTVDDDGLRVVGRRSGDVIALGDRMMVQIDDVSIERRTVFGRRLGRMIDDRDEPRPRDGMARPRRPSVARDREKVGRRDPTGMKQAAAEMKRAGRHAARDATPATGDGAKGPKAAATGKPSKAHDAKREGKKRAGKRKDNKRRK